MALLRSVPRLDQPRQARLDPVEGQPPDLTRLDGGCSFRPRCRFAVERCAAARPPLAAGRRAGPSRRPASAAPSSRRDARTSPHERAATGAVADARRCSRCAASPMHFPITEGIVLDAQDRRREGGRRRRLRRSGAARRWAWSARAAAARPRPAAASCGSSGRPPGEILFDGVDIDRSWTASELVALRRRIQVIFQDPYSSLNPRMKVGDIIGEPIKVHGIEPDARRRRDGCASCCRCAASTRSSPTAIRTRCRAASASASASPARWRSIRNSSSATRRCRRSTCRSRRRSSTCWRICASSFGLTYLFIAHDLSVVRHLCQRVAVMYLGRIVELADCDELFDNPLHPYTQALLAAVPVPDPRGRGGPRVPAAAGRGAEPDQPAVRLRLPSALPDGGRRLPAGDVPTCANCGRGHWVACSEV